MKGVSSPGTAASHSRYHADLAELAWARYDKVTVQASVPGADGQQLGAGAEEQLDNRPDPRAREAYAFFQHGAAELRGGRWMAGGARAGVGLLHACLTACPAYCSGASPVPSASALRISCVARAACCCLYCSFLPTPAIS